jgi:hypothetical protein
MRALDQILKSRHRRLNMESKKKQSVSKAVKADGKNNILRRFSMKRMSMISLLAVALTFVVAGAASASTSINTISSPWDGQEFVVDTLPATITVEGTISHTPGTINDQKVCVSVDSGAPTCEPAFVGGLGNANSRGYSIAVTIGTEGTHTLQASNANSSGDHAGISALITINIRVATASCDEVDPPAYANQYLNSLNLPNDYATYRGQIIRIIAFNHSNGVYGSCHYNYEAVESDVDGMLAELGF